MTPAARAAAAVASLLLAACSSSPNTPLSSRAEGGATDGTAEHPGDATDGPLDGDASGGDGGLCGRFSYSAMAIVTLHTPSGGTVSCNNSFTDAGLPLLAWSGVVTASDAASITIDTCAGGAAGSDGGASDASADGAPTDGGCSAAPLRVEVQAPGLDLSHFPHVRVHLRASITRFYQCQRSLEITADPKTADASASSGALILAVVDGAGPFDDSMYSVARVPLGCPGAPLCRTATNSADEYAFEFGGPGAQILRVYMGDTAFWTLAGATYVVHNLRSFQENCSSEDLFNWAYWIYVDPK